VITWRLLLEKETAHTDKGSDCLTDANGVLERQDCYKQYLVQDDRRRCDNKMDEWFSSHFVCCTSLGMDASPSDAICHQPFYQQDATGH
jgi:hypothetical protein